MMILLHHLLPAGTTTALLLLLWIRTTAVNAFTTHLVPRASSSSFRVGAFSSFSSFSSSPSSPSSSSSLLRAAAADNDVLIISPPGGIGEMTSVEAAKLGGNVKWFVVSGGSSNSNSNSNNNELSMTSETLAAISSAGGRLEVAGANAASLLVAPSEEVDGSGGKNDALAAMSEWSSSIGSGSSSGGSVIVTYDGAADEGRRVDRDKTPEQSEQQRSNVNEEEMICSAIRVASREVAAKKGNSGAAGAGGGGAAAKIALLGANEEREEGGTAESDDEDREGGGGNNFFANLFGNKDGMMEPPANLREALGKEGLSVVRYGDLFGAPESSPESSPFMGGPRRDPVVRDMYTLRSVRIDPTTILAFSSSSQEGDGSKSNRLALAEAVSRLGLGKLPTTTANKNQHAAAALDVSLSSYAGTEPPTDEEWNAEFQRAISASSELLSASSSSSSSSAILFRAEFSSVPNMSRLGDWIATKWAPAILRSYDIAGTRVGARPVYALQTSGDDESATVEIVWQELVDFQSVTSGKMIIEMDNDGMTARRGGGDAARGFGAVSSVPLSGEDILVRRLGDAASQAMEKGLAMKPKVEKKEVAVAAKEPVSTLVASDAAATSAATAAAPPTTPSAATSSSSGPGPRSVGARRSSQRSRGSRRRSSKKPDSSPSDGE